MTTRTPDRADAPERTGSGRTTAALRQARAASRVASRVAARAAEHTTRAALSPARAAAQTLRYWYAERATLRQGMVSLSISAVGNIPTGLALGAMTHRLELLPGLFLMIPAAIGMRGAIFGALGSRLGTSLQLGSLTFTTDRNGVLAQNVVASAVQTFSTSLFLAVAARAVTLAMGVGSISIWDFVVVSVLGGVASSVIVMLVTIWLAAVGSRRGWDLDAVAAPIITFVGDVVTLPALFLASYVAARGTTTLLAGLGCAAASIAVAWTGYRSGRRITKRILRESTVTLALAGMVNLIAGAVVEQRVDRFFALPALLVMLPPFLENAGALGGIVSSRLASKLHLGAIRPRAFPERLAALDISLAGPWALLNFALTGLSAHLVARALGFASPGAAHMTGIALLAGAMATAGAAVVSYVTAVATFRFDLDPDNHGIAAVTSTMDLIGVICVVFAVAAVGVG